MVQIFLSRPALCFGGCLCAGSRWLRLCPGIDGWTRRPSPSAEVQGIIVKSRSLHFGPLSMAEKKQRFNKKRKRILPIWVCFFCLFLKSRICKNYFFLLDFQVIARCSCVSLDLSNAVWKGSMQQKGMFESFLAFWLCGQPLGIPTGAEISATALCSWKGPSYSMAFQKWALLKWRLFQFKCHCLSTCNYRWSCSFSQVQKLWCYF